MRIPNGWAAGIVCGMVAWGAAWAMDVDLWQVPVPAHSQVTWKDKAIEVNGIHAQGTHLRMQGGAIQILEGFRADLEQAGWELKDSFRQQHVFAFVKSGRYLYVGVRENGPQLPADVYLISSDKDLAICKVIAGFMNEGIMKTDSPGNDLPDIPRFQQSKRIISILAPESGAILLYQTPADPGEVAQYYLGAMKGQGWHVLMDINPRWIKQMVPAAERAADVYAMVFERGKDVVVLNVNTMVSSSMQQYTLVTATKNMMGEFGYTPPAHRREAITR